MSTEEEIARAIASAQNVPFVGPKQRRMATAVMPLVKRAQAEALREVAAAYWADVDLFRTPEMREWLNARADRIENEGAEA